MGLDMYLNAERFLWTNMQEEDSLLQKAMMATMPENTPGEIKTIIVEAGYWRKANHIHEWFVKNVQDGVDECQRSYVSREHLQQLRDLCQAVVDGKDPGDTLPTAGGFFFGSTDYDEYYLQDTKDTIAICDKCLATEEREWDFYYQASW